MSWKASSWAAKQVAGGTTPKAVLYAIANYADSDGTCWCNQQTIADDIEASVDTVQRQLKALELSELIVRTRRPNKDRRRQSDLIVLCMRENADIWQNMSPKMLHRNLQGNPESDVSKAAPVQGNSYTAPVQGNNESYTAHSPNVTPQVCGLHIEAEPSLEPSLSASAQEAPEKDHIFEKVFSVEQKQFAKKFSDFKRSAKNNPTSLKFKTLPLLDDYENQTNIFERAKQLGLIAEFRHIASSVLFGYAQRNQSLDVAAVDKRICQLGFAGKMDKVEALAA